jgi:hypothetical protein
MPQYRKTLSNFNRLKIEEHRRGNKKIAPVSGGCFENDRRSDRERRPNQHLKKYNQSGNLH